jgi:hypothetical protein
LIYIDDWILDEYEYKNDRIRHKKRTR